MNTEKIDALFLTIEKGSITAAAEHLNYTPSAISRCIQSLENELGVPLISRSRQGVEITAAGELLLPDLRRMIHDRDLLIEHASQLNEGASGTIRVGMCYPAFYPWFSSAVAGFRAQYPDVKYTVKHGSSSVLMEQVRQRAIDLCIISKRDDSYGWVPLIEDEMIAILPADHPYADKRSVPVSIYADEPYLELHSGLDTDNSRTLAAAGVRPSSVIELDDSSALYPMVEAGLGIGMENRINTAGLEGNFVIKPLDPPQLIGIGIAFREDILPVTRGFIEHLTASRDALIKRLSEWKQ